MHQTPLKGIVHNGIEYLPCSGKGLGGKEAPLNSWGKTRVRTNLPKAYFGKFEVYAGVCGCCRTLCTRCSSFLKFAEILSGEEARAARNGKKKVFRNQFSQKSPRALHVLNHGWWRLAVGGWRLAVGNWRLAAVGGGWRRLVVGDWWLVVVGSGWQLAAGRRWRLAAVGGWRLVTVGGWRLVAVGG